MADQVLIYADTVRSPELRHEVPVGIGDPFLYAETNGTRHALTNVLEKKKLEDLGLEVHLGTDYGIDDLIKEGRKPTEIGHELALRACRDFGIEDAVVPYWFPVELADFLRTNGIELRPDLDFFDDRRRVKSEAEIAGIRRAQRAAEAGMSVARDMLKASEPNGDSLLLDGAPLTSERIKLAIGQVFTEHDCTAEDFIVARGEQGARGHDMGSGPIAPGEPVVIDLWPKDRVSACYADMTRTFVAGEPSEEIIEWHRLCKEALDRTIEPIEPGVKGRVLFDIACDIFEEHGQKTQRTKEPGESLDEGFFHSLGHGVGLEVHEEPGLGLLGEKEFIAGDVVTIEPGLYRQGFGGVRLEDLILVTEDGYENLTDFPYDLAP
ncbi:MAG: aminopeptidase P family protein [Actinobacteria bacterium]|nr:aminopeptidase P family protein [Actinomycetota bacterium]